MTDPVQAIEAAYPVMDGFMHKSRLRCNLTFLAMALPQWEALRRSGRMRPRQWLIPEDSNAIRIPARDAYEKQIYVKPGSAMFGYILIGNWGMVSVGQLTCRITDACTGVSLTSEPLTRRQAGPPAPQQYFPKLLVIGEPGTLDVEISSTFPTDQVAQVVLCGGEPA